MNKQTKRQENNTVLFSDNKSHHNSIKSLTFMHTAYRLKRIALGSSIAAILCTSGTAIAVDISSFELTGGNFIMSGTAPDPIVPGEFAVVTVGGYDGGARIAADTSINSIGSFSYSTFGPVLISTAADPVPDGSNYRPLTGTIDPATHALTLDLDSWTAWFGGTFFNQGTNTTCVVPDFVIIFPGEENCSEGPATTTYDPATGIFTAAWKSVVVGGGFNNQVGEWSIEGIINAAPVPGTVSLSVNQDSSNSATSDLVAAATDNYFPFAITLTACNNDATTGTVFLNGNSCEYSPDTGFIGTDSFTYTLNDKADGSGDSSTGTITVTVNDNIAPVITILGGNSISINVGDTFTPPTASAIDNYDNVVTVGAPTGFYDVNAAGVYELTYSATDDLVPTNGNTGTVILTLTVVDVSAPTITLLGTNPTNLNEGTSYSDAGCTALANDGITAVAPCTCDDSTVNSNVPGTYNVVCSATDAFGTGSDIRTVNVLDITPPNITVIGTNPLTANIDTTYTDAGAVATDNVDTSVTVIPTINVDTSIPGSYTVDYSATDNAGNNATAQRIVNVVDNIPPVITIIDNTPSPTTVDQNAIYTDKGATANDNIDGTVPVNSVSTVDTNLLGCYTVTYTAQDNATPANVQTAVRDVCVLDAEAPLITIFGSATVTLQLGTTYFEPGVLAIDAEDGDISSNIVTTGTLDTNTAGTYILTYTTTDVQGNTASTTRTINVNDTSGPELSLNGSSMINLIIGDAFVDEGATASDNLDGNIAVTVTGDTVDTNTVGTYTITYSATNSRSNTTTVDRTVKVSKLTSNTTPKDDDEFLGSIDWLVLSGIVGIIILRRRHKK